MVRAAGVTPADVSHVAQGKRAPFPRGVGYEMAGVLTAIRRGTQIASGGGAVGDEVLAFRVLGGWSSAITVPARDVFAKPESLTFEQAENLLLAATTASEMLHLTAPVARPVRPWPRGSSDVREVCGVSGARRRRRAGPGSRSSSLRYAAPGPSSQ
jgi:NADPH:quinone reductase-like Zn-dependent oxidoreductase